MSARRDLGIAVRLAAITVLGALLLTACGLLDAACWSTYVTEEEVCQQLERIDTEYQRCKPLSAPPSEDRQHCENLASCLSDGRAACADTWTRLLECLDSEHRCEDIEEGTGVSGWCQRQLNDFAACRQQDAPIIGRNEFSASDCWTRECDGDGACDPAAGEAHPDCPDCADKCTLNGSCEVVNGEMPNACNDCSSSCDGDGVCDHIESPGCSDCTCDLDLRCDPATENSASCPVCRCDGDGTCDPGESTWNCQTDCPCNLDGTCAAAEDAEWCSDCS